MGDLIYQQDDQNFRRILYKLIYHKKIAIFISALIIALASYSMAVSENQPIRHTADAPTNIEQTSSVNTQLNTETSADRQGESPEAAQPEQVQLNSSNSGSAEVMVNGESVPVPANGTVHKTITTPSGQATVDISNQTNSAGSSGGSSSFTSLNTSVTSTSNDFTSEVHINSNGESP